MTTIGQGSELTPEDIGGAYAAAGVLSAHDTEDVGALRRLMAQTLSDVDLPGAPLHEWTPPSQEFLERTPSDSLASAWRQAMSEVIPIAPRPAVVRLWLHTNAPNEAAARLGLAPPPPEGLLVLSASKGLGRTRAVPRWTWPLVVGLDITSNRMAELLVNQPAWLPNLVTFVDLHDPYARCCLALLPDQWTGSLVDPFGRPRTAAAVVLGTDPGDPCAPIMLDERGLGAIAAVAFSGDSDPGYLVEIIRHLSHDLTFDEAVSMAARPRGGVGVRVYGERPFFDRTRLRQVAADRAVERAPYARGQVDGYWGLSAADLADRYLHQPFNSEVHDASNLARDLRNLDGQTQRFEQRFLRGEAVVGETATRGPAAVANIALHVWIGPYEQTEPGAAVPIDESTLEWDGDTVDLTVVLIPLDARSRPRRQAVSLRRTGESTIAEFSVRASVSKPFRGRLAVLRDRRFVQTALVTVTAHGAVTIDLETVVRPLTSDLLDVVPADVAIVHNHDRSGRALMTTVTEDDAWSAVPRDMSKTTRWFQQQLETVADNPEQYETANSPAFERFVVELALRGHELNRRLFAGRASAVISPSAAERLTASERVSVLSAVAGDVLPIEFVYDRELSVGPGKPGHLCPNAHDAAKHGQCCASSPETTPWLSTQTVCPFGFWGVRKVIERHVNRDDSQRLTAAGLDHALALSPTIDNNVATLRAVLGGASGRADLNPAEAWSAAMELLRQRLSDNVRFAESWIDWATNVQAAGADILLLLPHVGNEFLEIGNDSSLELFHDLTGYVGTSVNRQPIVLLLGCATAGGMPLVEFTSKFLDAKARYVIATLAVVRGRFVAPLGANLALQILDQSHAGGVQLGELLRRLRLESFVRGDPTALGLVAFGDSSWLAKSR